MSHRYALPLSFGLLLVSLLLLRATLAHAQPPTTPPLRLFV